MNSQRIVIFDSPDGTGKTEMARDLANYSFVLGANLPYFRMGSQHRNFAEGLFKTALEFDQTYISEFLFQTGHSVVIDRAYPSEWVYSKVFDRDTNEDVLAAVDEKFAEMGTVIVISRRRDYSKNREDEVIANDRLQEIDDLYEEFVNDFTSCRTIQIFVDDFDNKLDRELPALVMALKRHWSNEDLGRHGDRHLMVHVEDGQTRIDTV